MIAAVENLTILGRYTIIRELARGGMSVVYLAQDTELTRVVAIKCVDASSPTTAELAIRLRAEAQLLAQLNHPNIVQLYDFVEQGDVIGLVIEYVGGDTLSQRLKRSTNREMILRWLAEVAEGIANAHSLGIAHCDLKSDNILITNNNIAKVADFGIAKVKVDEYLEGDGLVCADSVNGSYFSLSPEQATGQPVDTRTDIFSLAILIYQALLNEHPFGDTANKNVLLNNIINAPFEPSQSIQNYLGVRLTEMLKSSLSKRPNERLYHSSEIAELLRSELNTVLDNSQSGDTGPIRIQPALLRGSVLTSNRRATFLHISASHLVVMVLSFLLAFGVFQLWPNGSSESSEVSYIALDNIKVTASDEFNPALLTLIEKSLQQSTENTLLSFERVGLIDAKELNSVGGDFDNKAKASGVKDIVVVSANCLQQKCDIKIQRRSGKRMAIIQQSHFPVASDSIVALQNAISIQIVKLFNRNSLSFSRNIIALSDDDYRRYLAIYLDSNSGVSDDKKHFEDIQKLINKSPNFQPSYHLLYRLGGYLYRNTGGKDYLTKVLAILEDTPPFIKNNKAVRRTKIRLLLDLGQVAGSKVIFTALQQEVDDQLFLSKIESSIAHAEDDYDKLLQLDRQNAIWRPSVNNLYNLATSEFFIGNIAAAKQKLEEALALSPNDFYSLDFKASIEMSLGNLPSAIQTYESLLKHHTDSGVYSNYGLVLTLDKQYQKAVEAYKKAIQINPKLSAQHLNIADTYFLSGQFELSKKSYNQVLVLSLEPKTAQQYSNLAQAYAHLGKYQKAVKTLKIANEKFSSVAELDYAASIVNTLASNYIAAIVDINDAVENGKAPIWFSFEWFTPLCEYQEFQNITGAATNKMCN